MSQDRGYRGAKNLNNSFGQPCFKMNYSRGPDVVNLVFFYPLCSIVVYMKTLKEANDERIKQYQELDLIPRKNGIACPECGKELYDAEPGVMLTSDPPQKRTSCTCGYRGYRIA